RRAADVSPPVLNRWWRQDRRTYVRRSPRPSALETPYRLPYTDRAGTDGFTEGHPMGNDRPGRVTADTSPSRAGVAPAPFPASLQPRFTLLYHFCRLQMPAIALDSGTGQRHLQRTYDLFRTKPDVDGSWTYYLDNLYPLDWFLA